MQWISWSFPYLFSHCPHKERRMDDSHPGYGPVPGGAQCRNRGLFTVLSQFNWSYSQPMMAQDYARIMSQGQRAAEAEELRPGLGPPPPCSWRLPLGAGPAAGVVDYGEDVEVWVLVEQVDGHTVGEELTLPAGSPRGKPCSGARVEQRRQGLCCEGTEMQALTLGSCANRSFRPPDPRRSSWATTPWSVTMCVRSPSSTGQMVRGVESFANQYTR